LPNGLDQNRQDINVNGTNTRLSISGGDVGSNSSVFTNSGGQVVLDPGYFIFHFDDINPDPWNKVLGLPQGRLISQLIPDPNYLIPHTGTLPTYTKMNDGIDPGCSLATPAAVPAGAVCYKPGIYSAKFRDNKNTDVSYLEPGRYFFNGGLDISGSLIGGNVTGGQGVIIWVPKNASIALNNALKISLNYGPDTCTQDSCRSGPALDEDLTPLRTPQGLNLTIEVEKDSSCFVGLTPLEACSGTSVLTMPGNGNSLIGGVVYAPSDKIVVSGNNSNSVGTVGQIIGWTVTYQGGAELNQVYPGIEGPGILRLDEACSAFNSPCN
jgi:hypothetical protein